MSLLAFLFALFRRKEVVEVKEPIKKPVNKPKKKPVAPWLTELKKYDGLKEETGKNDHPLLDKWWSRFNLGWLIGQPWCGLVMAVIFEDVGIEPPKAFYRAKNWLDWGVEIETPVHGCIVVFKRTGGYHVGVVESIDENGRLHVKGGNQSNAVNTKPFTVDRVEGYRVPKDYKGKKLKVVASNDLSSTNEA